jgi:hypothetical protein
MGMSCVCCSTSRRLLLLDYDGTLIPHRNISAAPPAEVRGPNKGMALCPCCKLQQHTRQPDSAPPCCKLQQLILQLYVPVTLRQ